MLRTLPYHFDKHDVYVCLCDYNGQRKLEVMQNMVHFFILIKSNISFNMRTHTSTLFKYFNHTDKKSEHV